MDYRCVLNIQELKNYINNSRLIAFDFETSPTDKFREWDKAALDPYKAVIVGISFSVTEDSGIYVPLNHRIGRNANDPDEILCFLKASFFESSSVIKIAHNLSFEAMFLYHMGIVVQPPCYDTMAASQMTLKSNTEFRNLSDSGLKTLVPELYDTTMPKFEEVTGGRHFDELDPQDSETIRYACADSDFALRLYHTFNNWFDRFLPKHRFIVEELESPTAVYVGIIKHNGLLMEKELMLLKQQEAEHKLAQLKEDIAFFTGDVDIGENAVTAAFKNYLYKDLQLPVLKTTAKYKEAADDETMIMLSDWCGENRPELVKLFELIQEYRKWGKLKSTYIDGYLEYINSETGRIHPDLFPLGTDTGRFACRKPNLQNQSLNLPVNVRSFIIAEEGYVLLEADYSQIELRIAAYISKDNTMLEAYRNDEDIHAITTSAIFHIPLKEAMEKQRQDYKKRRTVAKSTIFGVLYGIYKKGLKRNLKTSAGIDMEVEECDIFIKNLKAKYSTLAVWQNETIKRSRLRGYVETKFGRRRYVPNITSEDFMKRGNAERAALNHGVQGLAADILKLSMNRLVKELASYQWIKPVLTVHDSLVFYVPDKKVNEAARIIKHCMESTPPFEDFNVPIIAEIAVGKSYGSMKELEVKF